MSDLYGNHIVDFLMARPIYLYYSIFFFIFTPVLDALLLYVLLIKYVCAGGHLVCVNKGQFTLFDGMLS